MTYYVGKENSSDVWEFQTKREAEAQIEELEKTDPKGVHAGEYFIDGPEEEVGA